jgi:hypothetical protein
VRYVRNFEELVIFVIKAPSSARDVLHGSGAKKFSCSIEDEEKAR